MILWFLIGTTVLMFILLHLPAVQHYIGSRVSSTLSEKLGTKVEVGRVDLGFLNRVIIDDVVIYDQKDKKMLSSSRLSAKVDIAPLFSGEVSISSAQVFGMDAVLYKENEDAQPNYQFVLDSLSSKQSKDKSPLHLNINSLIIRNGHVKYDQWDQPIADNQLSPYHLDISNISGHLMLDELTDEKIDLKVKKLSMREASGIDLRRLSFKLKATKEKALLTDLSIEMPSTSLLIDTLKSDFAFNDDHFDLQSLHYQVYMPSSVVTPSDLSSIIPSLREFTGPIHISTQFHGTHNSVIVDRMAISSENDILRFSGDGIISHWDTQPLCKANIHEFSIKAYGIEKISKYFGEQLSIPSQILQLGNIQYKGEVGVNGKEMALDGMLRTDAGDSQLSMVLSDKHFTGTIQTDGFQLGHVLLSDKIGRLATAIHIDGLLPISKNMRLTARGNISHLEYNGHTYNNIDIDGTYEDQTFKGFLGVDDPNGNIGIDGEFDLHTNEPAFNLTANIRHFNTDAFGITGTLANKIIDVDAVADFKGTDLNHMQGKLALNDFHLISGNEDLSLHNMLLDVGAGPNGDRYIDMDCDYGHVNLYGKFDSYANIGNSVINVLQKRISTNSFLPVPREHHHNIFNIDATILDTEWLQQFSDIDIHLSQPLTISGDVNEPEGAINLNCTTNGFSYKDSDFAHTEISLKTNGDTLCCDAKTKKIGNDGRPLDLNVKANAVDNCIFSDITFDNHGEKVHLKGTVSSMAEFVNNIGGQQTVNINMLPSQILLNDTAWHVESSGISLAKRNININHLVIGNGDQHITVSGSATGNPADAITMQLHDINMSYLSSVLHFKKVDFGGHVTGTARMSSLFSTPEAVADLQIKDFRFVDGRIGDMDLTVNLDAQEKKLHLDGLATDEGYLTKVDGNIALSPLYLDINIHSDGTPLQFLERFCGTFMKNIEARAYGNLRIFGPNKIFNLEGQMVAEGDITLPALNTTYHMMHDTITLKPDHILFSADTIADRYGNLAFINGDVSHTHLSNFRYDLLIHANDLLSYDFKDFGNQTFCGTVFATGDCRVQGEPGEVALDINVTPTRNTVFYYNAASPDALNSQEFIKWNSNLPDISDFEYEGMRPAKAESDVQVPIGSQESSNLPTNIRMNFQINANPDATLRLLMDEGTGDYITLNGNGTLRANYFNKGSFNIFGNYVVEKGTYKLTIQNFLRKDFQFRPGGSITFVGNPYDATLALQAAYTVNGVPLSDLNLGRSFTSNNIRVNCLMNINGTAEQPTVDFDMEMPTVSSDAQQMVRSLINSEEELNQQVIYLLAIGRFYNKTYNADLDPNRQSQTSLAMQSLLSGTISQQINTLLGNIINNNNWNFGANISTGDEGWNNAEYEGTLSGRLLDNRLQINGQFGYRDNPNATTSFIGDFDIRYLLYPNGNLAVKVYNQTNDRYFIKNSLNTQGVGLILKKDFNGWHDLLGIKPKKEKINQPQNNTK